MADVELAGRAVTLSDLRRFAAAVGAAERQGWVGITTRVGNGIEGVARAVTDGEGNFLFGEDSVAGACLWVSGTLEICVPFEDIAEIEVDA